MRECQDASIVVVCVGHGSEAEAGELRRNFSRPLSGLRFDHQSVWPPSHNDDVVSATKFTRRIEPRRIFGA